jgi:predicted nucleic acid-binding protein
VILVDTGPLVALCDPRDGLHARAVRDLDRLDSGPFVTCASVLAEACFILHHAVQRERLRRLLSQLPIRSAPEAEPEAIWQDALQWMIRYGEHDPDWTDAFIVILASRAKRARLWTYDREFRTTWRGLDGRKVPLAVR